jgi:hypothetical protein
MLKHRGVTKRHPKSPSTSAESDALRSRFIEAMARRGVPELGARAVLRQITETARLSRTGRLTDEQACAKVALLMIRAEDKAAELARADIKAIAQAVKGGSLSLVDARSKLKGAA